jgi:integrase
MRIPWPTRRSPPSAKSCSRSNEPRASPDEARRAKRSTVEVVDAARCVASSSRAIGDLKATAHHWVREIPIHPDLRDALTSWAGRTLRLARRRQPRAVSQPARGRLLVKGAHDIITAIATAAGLEDQDVTAHVLRHTFATRLVRGAPTSSSSPSSSGTPAWKPRVPTADPPNRMRATLELLDVDH